jgi:hypothetical protein
VVSTGVNLINIEHISEKKLLWKNNLANNIEFNNLPNNTILELMIQAMKKDTFSD